MKKMLIRSKTFLVFGTYVLFFIIVFFVLYNYEKNNETRFMQYIIAEVETAYEKNNGDAQNFVSNNASNNNRRITILDSSGLVIATINNFDMGLDLSQRYEVLNLGEIDTRNVMNDNYGVISIASRLNDGNYLIIEVENTKSNLAYYWMILFLITSVVIILYYWENVENSRKLENSWRKVKTNLGLLKKRYKEVTSSNSYSEMNRIVHEMNSINAETKKNVSNQEIYHVQLSEILNQIKQGVMLFDQGEKLIYYNKDAKELFSIDKEDLKKPSYYIIRETKIKEAISKVNQNQEVAFFDFELGNKIIEAKVFSVPSFDKNFETTTLALFKDVSQQRAMEQMKRDFFSHASHELKSPLTAIKGNAELIALGMVKGEDVKKSALSIAKQTDTMSALVENMLTLSRIENLKEKVYQNNNLNDILNLVITQLRDSAEKKQIQINIESVAVKMVCDAFDMQKLFKNLIENSIKYSERRKEVFVTLKKENNQMLFVVADQGIGINKEQQQRVFERFYRVDKGRLDGGTGLGLAIVKHIVLKYKGTIDLQSSLVKGTKITIKI